MSPIHLYTTCYQEKNNSRNEELLYCITANAKNPAIRSVLLLKEGDFPTVFPPEITVLYLNKRPDYKDFFNAINNRTGQDDINIIANTDIFFDENIALLNLVDWNETCLALSRWEFNINSRPVLNNHNDSQDVWIFKGKIKEAVNGNFPMGVPRSDNRIMYELHKAGYKVLNPSFSIKAYHFHSGKRSPYPESNLPHFVLPPYQYMFPHNLYPLPRLIRYNLTHQQKLGRYRFNFKKLFHGIKKAVSGIRF